MKRQFWSKILLIVAPAMLCTANAAGAQPVPIKGEGVGQDQLVTLEPEGIHIISGAVGEATHVGRFQETLDYVLSYDLLHFAGAATITAADGDAVYFMFEGTIPGYANHVFPLPFTATFSIVGGTGRFAVATGSGNLDGIDYGQGKFDFTFDGIIDY